MRYDYFHIFTTVITCCALVKRRLFQHVGMPLWIYHKLPAWWDERVNPPVTLEILRGISHFRLPEKLQCFILSFETALLLLPAVGMASLLPCEHVHTSWLAILEPTPTLLPFASRCRGVHSVSNSFVFVYVLLCLDHTVNRPLNLLSLLRWLYQLCSAYLQSIVRLAFTNNPTPPPAFVYNLILSVVTSLISQSTFYK